MNLAIASHEEELLRLCREFRVRQLEVFGSAARADFDPGKSDFDFLVEFAPLSAPEYAAAFLGLKESLERLLGRPVDLVVASAVRNPYFRESIERDKVLLYAA